MKTRVCDASSRGIALIVVLIAIFVLTLIAGAFAYAMKVETKLAINTNHEAELEWLGRSGVEYARWVVANNGKCSFTALNQKWAGGVGADCETNGPLADISLNNVPVGEGTISIKLTELESKVNINVAGRDVLQQGLQLMGVDASEIPSITDGILDWVDQDNSPHLNGAESDYYESLDPPYSAKNGPIDDLSELLLVRGITQDMYWGTESTNHMPAAFQKMDRFGHVEDLGYAAGLVDLFTPVSTGRVNVNTASPLVLQMIPGMDEATVACIVRQREQAPFERLDELGTCVTPALMPQIMRLCAVRGSTYEVQVEASISGAHRTFYAIIGHNPQNPRDTQVLSFYWK